MLTKMIGFVATASADKARTFYRDVLGFRLLEDDEYALVFDANGTMLRVQKGRQSAPQPGTVLGWEVDDLASEIRALTARGVTFEQYNLAFMRQDALGIWSTPNGDQVAWFKDPDGNTLSLSSHRRSSSNTGVPP
jgi:catechol 2,3-dioxygenase-like lactoylglutathione lyase family enzyme